MSIIEFVAEWGQPPNLQTAIAQADATRDMGGEFAKWQMFHPDRLVSGHAVRYWDPALGGSDSQRHTFTTNGTLTKGEWKRLADWCREIDIGFLVTPFDLEAVDTLQDLGVQAVKIASADITYRALIEKVAALGCRVLLSTGAATVAEMDRALSWLGDDVTVMACDLVYPCPAADANLSAIGDLACFPSVGYSDHTTEIVTGAVAVTLGATVLEKHVTLDPDGVAPDHRMALTVTQAGEYVRLSELAATLTSIVSGDPQAAARTQARRSWHARRDLPAGHTLTGGDVVALRPCPVGALPVDRDPAGKRLMVAVTAGDPVPA